MEAVVNSTNKWDIDPFCLMLRKTAADDYEVLVNLEDVRPNQVAGPWRLWLLDTCWPHRPRPDHYLKELNLRNQFTYKELEPEQVKERSEQVNPRVAFPGPLVAQAYAVDPKVPARRVFEAAGLIDIEVGSGLISRLFGR